VEIIGVYRVRSIMIVRPSSSLWAQQGVVLGLVQIVGILSLLCGPGCAHTEVDSHVSAEQQASFASLPLDQWWAADSHTQSANRLYYQPHQQLFTLAGLGLLQSHGPDAVSNHGHMPPQSNQDALRPSDSATFYLDSGDRHDEDNHSRLVQQCRDCVDTNMQLLYESGGSSEPLHASGLSRNKNRNNDDQSDSNSNWITVSVSSAGGKGLGNSNDNNKKVQYNVFERSHSAYASAVVNVRRLLRHVRTYASPISAHDDGTIQHQYPHHVYYPSPHYLHHHNALPASGAVVTEDGQAQDDRTADVSGFEGSPPDELPLASTIAESELNSMSNDNEYINSDSSAGDDNITANMEDGGSEDVDMEDVTDPEATASASTETDTGRPNIDAPMIQESPESPDGSPILSVEQPHDNDADARDSSQSMSEPLTDNSAGQDTLPEKDVMMNDGLESTITRPDTDTDAVTPRDTAHVADAQSANTNTDTNVAESTVVGDRQLGSSGIATFVLGCVSSFLAAALYSRVCAQLAHRRLRALDAIEAHAVDLLTAHDYSHAMRYLEKQLPYIVSVAHSRDDVAGFKHLLAKAAIRTHHFDYAEALLHTVLHTYSHPAAPSAPAPVCDDEDAMDVTVRAMEDLCCVYEHTARTHTREYQRLQTQLGRIRRDMLLRSQAAAARMNLSDHLDEASQRNLYEQALVQEALQAANIHTQLLTEQLVASISSSDSSSGSGRVNPKELNERIHAEFALLSTTADPQHQYSQRFGVYNNSSSTTAHSGLLNLEFVENACCQIDEVLASLQEQQLQHAHEQEEVAAENVDNVRAQMNEHKEDPKTIPADDDRGSLEDNDDYRAEAAVTGTSDIGNSSTTKKTANHVSVSVAAASTPPRSAPTPTPNPNPAPVQLTPVATVGKKSSAHNSRPLRTSRRGNSNSNHHNDNHNQDIHHNDVTNVTAIMDGSGDAVASANGEFVSPDTITTTAVFDSPDHSVVQDAMNMLINMNNNL
jgi:hypothetical protein